MPRPDFAPAATNQNNNNNNVLVLRKTYTVLWLHILYVISHDILLFIILGR